ncbi:uncharacterized protein LOC110690047 [Chenopodium quinoa]|uniref:uncharacterized protein LOC110690047 n=1 Tax=Chenopodium quinoa TaxID=63459 RepID=UPI000B7888A5|nr:uncharacterized protein LOC110690047 [Chenopodium quinoa]
MMFGWHEALITAIFAGLMVIIFLILIIRRKSNQRSIATERHQQEVGVETEVKTTPLQTEENSKRRLSSHFFRRGSSTKSFFNWADHPALVTDAVENGWSRFAFTSYVSRSPSVRSSLFDSLRVTGDFYSSRESSSIINSTSINQVEESWEIGSGSVDFMQKLSFKIKGLNLGGGAVAASSSSVAKSVVRMALPLPGPPMVQSFPQEAYFEINVLNSNEDNVKFNGEGEKTKLLFQRSFSSTASSGIGKTQEGLFHVSSSRGSYLLEELKIGGGGRRGGGDGVKMSIGLSVGGFVTTRIPGSYPGSIGFNSDGSVFLGGMKLVFESENEDWAKTGRVIGCGFDPRKKEVYFTVDSELVHVIHCKSEDFERPLYPVIATKIGITMLVNLGQSSFSYLPANAHRTPNPCFIGPVVNSSAAALGYEDSKELFSMGRIDAEWLSHSATTKSTVSYNSDLYNNTRINKMDEYEDETEAEFIEIVLDSTKR